MSIEACTPEQSTKMVADYVAGVTVETIAENLGKTVRSVVAKLSREGVYKANVTVPATDLVISETEFANITAINVTVTGTNVG